MLSSQESSIAASHAVSFGHVLKVSNSQQKSQDSHAPLSIDSGSKTDSECLMHKLYFTCCDEHPIWGGAKVPVLPSNNSNMG